MKRFLITISITALCLFAVTASAAITGTKHDLSATIGGGQICIVCHAPHNNGVEGAREGKLLWNHEETAVPSYTLYSSPTLTATPGQPAGTSKLCMSCHDGTVAVDSYGGVTGTSYIDAEASFGTDLSNDHPISFAYPADPAADELKATTSPVTFGSGSGTVADMLSGGTDVECQSCHDVHDTLSDGNTGLLIVDNSGSGLCLSCHTK